MQVSVHPENSEHGGEPILVPEAQVIYVEAELGTRLAIEQVEYWVWFAILLKNDALVLSLKIST